MWCDNIKMVQDELSLWWSTELIISIAFGAIGFLILLISLLYEKWSEGTWTDVMWNEGTWTGVFMIFFCIFGIYILSPNASTVNVFMSDQKIELIGEVSDMEIDLQDRTFELGGGHSDYQKKVHTSGPVSYNTIRRDPQMFLGSYKLPAPVPMLIGPPHSRFSPRPVDIIWFKVDGRLIRSDVMTVGFNPGNECDGRKCGLRTGDQVRISLNKETLLKERPIIRKIDIYGKPNRKLEYRDYYSETLRIERCDDDLSAALSR